MKIKTSEATGLQLDWGLSIALGHEKTAYIAECGSVHGRDKERGWTSVSHTDPAVCMGLIEQYKVATRFYAVDGFWVATIYDHDPQDWISKTLPEAVARCVIAMQLGDEFEVPDELGVQL